MNCSDTLFATTRLTLGLAHRYDSESRQVDADTVLDRRKRKRGQDRNHGLEPLRPFECGQAYAGNADMLLTRRNTPLPRALNTDLPMLVHRYQPLSLAGDGAFSRTILARDTLDPRDPLVAIKAMKPGFETIGQNVTPSSTGV